MRIVKQKGTTTVNKPGTGLDTLSSISAGTGSEMPVNSSRVVVNVMRESLAIKGSDLITGK